MLRIGSCDCAAPFTRNGRHSISVGPRPRRAREMASLATRYTATTSLPSTVMLGNQGVSAAEEFFRLVSGFRAGLSRACDPAGARKSSAGHEWSRSCRASRNCSCSFGKHDRDLPFFPVLLARAAPIAAWVCAASPVALSVPGVFCSLPDVSGRCSREQQLLDRCSIGECRPAIRARANRPCRPARGRWQLLPYPPRGHASRRDFRCGSAGPCPALQQIRVERNQLLV